MTPQLQQAFRLLQLPALELQAQVEQALDANVMLESDEEFDATWALDSAPNEARAGRARASARPMAGRSAGTLQEARCTITSRGSSSSTPLPNGPRAIGRALIDAINDDGYLTRTTQAIAAAVAGEVRADAGVVESVLAIIQQFDPAGVGARSVSECIGLQLAQLEPGTPGLDTARRIARHHLELAESQQLQDLQRLTGCSGPELEAALALVRSGNRRPGAAFQSLRAEYVVPDVVRPAHARRLGGRAESGGHPARAPERAVRRHGHGLGGPGDVACAAAGGTAGWCEASRSATTRCSGSRARSSNGSRPSWTGARRSMRPMTLPDVAKAVDMHESTVSRVTIGKYLHTPRGVLEFWQFFSGRGRLDAAAQ